MAESVVSFAVERLGDLLIQEAVFLHGIREQVELLKVELRRMKCFLRDADAKQDENERVRNWVAEIRDVAYDAEDVIDTFIFKVASIRRNQSVFKRCAFFFVKIKELHRVGVEIQTIQARISDISTSRETYGIQNLGEGEGLNERWRQLRRSYPHFEDENIIGLEDHTKMLVAELIKEKEQPRVIAIVGMGGSGKTTLAKKIYNHNETKRHFDCCAWTFISQQCRTEEVLREILRQTGSSVGDGDRDLMVMLHNRLKEKRYLVVLDDIWSTEAWDLLKPAFPKGKTCMLMQIVSSMNLRVLQKKRAGI